MRMTNTNKTMMTEKQIQKMKSKTTSRRVNKFIANPMKSKCIRCDQRPMQPMYFLCKECYAEDDGEPKNAGEEIMGLKLERDKYASMLCEAMMWVYACPVENEYRQNMIQRFEALELTPTP